MRKNHQAMVYKEDVIDLLMRISRVSVETMKIIDEMEMEFIEIDNSK